MKQKHHFFGTSLFFGHQTVTSVAKRLFSFHTTLPVLDGGRFFCLKGPKICFFCDGFWLCEIVLEEPIFRGNNEYEAAFWPWIGSPKAAPWALSMGPFHGGGLFHGPFPMLPVESSKLRYMLTSTIAESALLHIWLFLQTIGLGCQGPVSMFEVLVSLAWTFHYKQLLHSSASCLLFSIVLKRQSQCQPIILHFILGTNRTEGTTKRKELQEPKLYMNRIGFRRIVKTETELKQHCYIHLTFVWWKCMKMRQESGELSIFLEIPGNRLPGNPSSRCSAAATCQDPNQWHQIPHASVPLEGKSPAAMATLYDWGHHQWWIFQFRICGHIPVAHCCGFPNRDMEDRNNPLYDWCSISRGWN